MNTFLINIIFIGYAEKVDIIISAQIKSLN